MHIETTRLLLREWRDEDLLPFYHMHQDPFMMEFLGNAPSLDGVTNFIRILQEHEKQHGFTLWAVELKETKTFLGAVGLQAIEWEAPFTPAIGIGWRLGTAFWGQGYATEGAQAALEIGFSHYRLPEIVAITTPKNVRSLRVMEKLGLERDPHGDFHHPKVPEESPLSRHVLYRMTYGAYRIRTDGLNNAIVALYQLS